VSNVSGIHYLPLSFPHLFGKKSFYFAFNVNMLTYRPYVNGNLETNKDVHYSERS